MCLDHERLAQAPGYTSPSRDEAKARRPIKAPDQSFFIVTRDFGRLGFESVSDPDATRDSIISDIASGQIDRVAYVIECNPVEGWSCDITSDITEAVAERLIKAA